MKRRIVVFFNRGKEVAKLYDDLREAYGDVQIIALVPRGYLASEAEKAGAEVRHLTGRGPMILRDALRIRRERPEYFLVFFESLKLRTFAALAGPGRVIWWRGKQHSQELPVKLAATLLDLTVKRSRGMWVLAKMYANIYFRRFT